MGKSCAAFALVTAIRRIWGATAIFARYPTNPNPAIASSSINVMQMMKSARNLPEENLDTHRARYEFALFAGIAARANAAHPRPRSEGRDRIATAGVHTARTESHNQ
jgi:hypothetical protein